jgi:hypothetical protein
VSFRGIYLAQNIYVHRLVCYLHVDKQSTWFILDIFRLLNKYGLEEKSNSYIWSGLSSSKYSWKFTLQNVIGTKASTERADWLIWPKITVNTHVTIYSNKIAFDFNWLWVSRGRLSAWGPGPIIDIHNRLAENKFVHKLKQRRHIYIKASSC